MRKFDAVRWQRFAGLLARAEELKAAEKIGPDFEKVARETLTLFKAECEQIGLTASAISLGKALTLIANPDSTTADLKKIFSELHGRLEDEMGAAIFLSLSAADAHYYALTEPFGSEVATAFPSIQFDLEEAAKCLALDRATACVFHLMRVMELGLRQLSTSLGQEAADPSHNPTWDAMLKPCRVQLEKPLAQRSPQWRTDDQFYSAAVGHLMAVKDAWRNPTMHIEATYDAGRALEVWGTVRIFMRHLAGKLSE